MIIKTDDRGRVQISVTSTVTNVSLQTAQRMHDDLGQAITEAKAKQAKHLRAVGEAHARMAEALS